MGLVAVPSASTSPPAPITWCNATQPSNAYSIHVCRATVQRLMLEGAGGLLHREHGPRQRLGGQRPGRSAAAKPAANQTVDDAMRSGAALPSCGWQWPACSPLGRLWICRLRGRSRYHVTVDVCGTVLRGAPGRPRDRRALALGGEYDGIIVTNYLHRPLLPAIARALTAGGYVDLRDLHARQRKLRHAAQSRFPASPG